MFFPLLYRKSPDTPFPGCSHTELAPALQTHGSGYTLLPHQQCPGTLVWTRATGLGKTLAEQSREAAAGACQATPGNCPGMTQLASQKHARNVSSLQPEDFRCPCLGGRNTPSHFTAPFISDGAADSGPTQVTDGGTTAAV